MHWQKLSEQFIHVVRSKCRSTVWRNVTKVTFLQNCLSQTKQYKLG